MSFVPLDEFNKSGLPDWAKAAQKDLNGDDPFERLKWNFEPGLSLAPYYTAGIHPSYSPPIAGPAGWSYLSPVDIHSATANRAALEALQGSEGLLWLAEFRQSYPAVDTLLKGIELEYCYNAFELNAWNKGSREFLESINNYGQLSGFLFYSSDLLSRDREILTYFSGQKSFRPLCYNGIARHEKGFSPSAEVAWLLSSFIESADRVLQSGLGVDQLLRKTVFCVGLGRDYFHEIAKIRALKLAVLQVAKAFGAVNAGTDEVCVFARPSLRTFSATDPHVNIIRSTAEAMAGVIGGISFLSIPRFDHFHPFNPSGFTSRIARNISNLLKSESYVDKVADPAAGSYYLEHLTEKLAAAAWQKMQEAESLGGFSKAEAGGFWNKVQKEFANKEQSLVSSRRLNLVGVNSFNDLDIIRDFPSAEAYLSAIQKAGVDPMGEQFEQLRIQTEDHINKQGLGERPSVSAVLFGDRSKALARYGFIQGFFPVAGIKVNPPVWWQGSTDSIPRTTAIILCSSDEEYIEGGISIANHLRKHFPVASIAIAGDPPEKEGLTKSGISTFIHLKSDALEVLKYYQKLFGIV